MTQVRIRPLIDSHSKQSQQTQINKQEIGSGVSVFSCNLTLNITLISTGMFGWCVFQSGWQFYHHFFHYGNITEMEAQGWGNNSLSWNTMLKHLINIVVYESFYPILWKRPYTATVEWLRFKEPQRLVSFLLLYEGGQFIYSLYLTFFTHIFQKVSWSN